MFELFSPISKVIVIPQSEEIYLHGARDLNTLNEVDPVPIAMKYNYKLAPSFDKQVILL